MKSLKRRKRIRAKAIISSSILISSLLLYLEAVRREDISPALNNNETSFIEENYIEDTFPPAPPVEEIKPSSPPPHLDFPEEEKEEEFPPIPLEFQRPLKEADLSYKDNPTFLHTHGISLKNATQYSNEEISRLLDTDMKMRFKDTDEPQILIYHTHATESFNPRDEKIYDKRYNWRSRDNTLNMVSVGFCALNELDKEGIPFIHDTSQHDYPSYNGSYKNSFNSVSEILSQNKEIKVALDLHRDAIQSDSGLVTKPVITLPDGKKAAQIMIIANCDDGSGLIPLWRENFRFAKELYLSIEKICPGICRPILLSHRKYNQQLSTGCLLIEVGGHGNTLKEAQRSGRILGLALKDIYENFKE